MLVFIKIIMNSFKYSIHNFCNLCSYFCINSYFNKLFKPQNISKKIWGKIVYFGSNNIYFILKYFEYINTEYLFIKVSLESLINILFDKLIKNNIKIKCQIIFNISKTQEEKEIFLQKLIDNNIFECPIKYCFQIYQLSEHFFINNIDKFNNMDDSKNFEKSKDNISNKFILKNISKIPIDYFYQDQTRIFSQKEISKILNFYANNVKFSNPKLYITSRLLNHSNLEKLINIVQYFIKVPNRYFTVNGDKNLQHFNYVLKEFYGRTI